MARSAAFLAQGWGDLLERSRSRSSDLAVFHQTALSGESPETCMFDRTTDAADRVARADAIGQFRENFVGRGEVGLDVVLLMRQARIESGTCQDLAIEHPRGQQRLKRERIGMVEGDRRQRRMSRDLERHTMTLGHRLQAGLPLCADCPHVRGHVDLPQLANRGQCGRWPHAFGPIGAGNERILRRLHDRRATDDGRHGMAIAQGLGEDRDVGLPAVQQMGGPPRQIASLR